MFWVIIGLSLISFIIQIYVLKHTYTLTIKGDLYFDWKRAKKIGIPLWIVLVMLITSIIPFANIAEVFVFWIVWLKYYLNPEVCCRNDWYTYWRFKDKFFSREI